MAYPTATQITELNLSLSVLLFGHYRAMGRDQHDHPTRACPQVPSARQHPRHSSAHHRGVHGGRQQHVACRGACPNQPGCGRYSTNSGGFVRGDLSETTQDLQDDTARARDSGDSAVQARVQALQDLQPHRPVKRDRACSTAAVSDRHVVQELQSLEARRTALPTSTQVHNTRPPRQLVS